MILNSISRGLNIGGIVVLMAMMLLTVMAWRPDYPAITFT